MSDFDWTHCPVSTGARTLPMSLQERLPGRSQAHWGGLAAADLFTVEVLTLGGLSAQQRHEAADFSDRARFR